MAIKLPMDIEKSYIHLLPGRLRLDVPGLLHNQTLAEQLAKKLGSRPGIRVGYVNPVSGRILIYFNQDKVKIGLLLSEMLGFSPQPNQAKHWPFATERIHPVQKRNTLPNNLNIQTNESRIPWHTLASNDVLSRLQSSAKSGLSSPIVEQRLKQYGYNELITKPKPSIVQMFLEPLKGFMPKLLLLAAGVSLVVGEATDALVIVVIVGLQSVIEAFQGYRAEKSLAALQELSAPTASVLRDGQIIKLQAKELVPGDIIVLEAGDRVPADARLVQEVNLSTNESCLTGESLPVAKNDQTSQELRLPIGDRLNMVFAGTMVTGGRGLAVVTATGMHTEMGNIAGLLKDVENEPTVLQRQMESLGKNISKLVGISVGIIAVINLLQGRPFLEILRTGVSLAVGAIPEGLPAVVTVALAAGVQRMAKRNAVVRHLTAVESLGSTTVICTDKTGTLTKNEMTVKEIYTDGETYQITGEGYQPNGKFFRHNQVIEPQSSAALTAVLKIGVLCNNAQLFRNNNGSWEMTGDPTEGALVTAAAKAGIRWEGLRQEHCRKKEIAFNSGRRMMTVVCLDNDGSHHVYVKGAVDTILDRCTQVWHGGILVNLDLKMRRNILAANEAMAGKALRVLATAWKTLPLEIELEQGNLETGLIFAGLTGMVDPPRPCVKRAIKKCHLAGVKVVMITGDHQKTAEAIAENLGILQNGISITGDCLEDLTEEQLISYADKTVVYSRTSPDQKLRIVRALKKRGYIVAMTGDGVNDAPAVKEADIGVAMGLSGTDVTREASGITLSDDNFATIVAGIEEGRTVGENLTKSVRYVLSGSVGQVLAVFMAAVAGLPTPLLPPQILWINLVTEGLPAIALTADAPHPECMSRPPLRPEQRFSAKNKKEIVRKGILVGLTTFGVYAGGLAYGWPPMKARTLAFSHLVMGRVFSLFETRRSINAGTIKNPYILPAAGLSTAMLLLTMYVPVIRPLFSTIPMGLADWAIIGFTSSFVGWMDNWVAHMEKKVNHTRLLSAHKPVALLQENPKH